MNIQFAKSLKGRFVLVAAFLGLLVILVAYFGYRNVNMINDATTKNVESRRHLLESVSNIRIKLFESYRALDAYLLDPMRKDAKKKIHTYISQTIEISQSLLESAWIAENNFTNDVDQLITALNVLIKDIDELSRIRVEPTLQYPSLKLSNEILRPSRNDFNNAMALVMNEYAGKSGTVNINVYNTFSDTRYLWSQTVSNFRLYLANRVGSFNEAALPTQEQAITTMYNQLEDKLKQLQDFDDKGQLSFESSAALIDMKTAAKSWYAGFLRVMKIHQSNAWRADTSFIKSRIEPGLKIINTLLSAIERQIEVSGNNDLRTLSYTANFLSRMLVLITLFGLGFILFVLLSLQKLVFSPIESVARALKAEAFGKQGELLPHVRSIETQNLIDAFSEMRKQVHNRQADLEHQALHDALTQLPNRTLLQDRMEHAIHSARRDNKNVTLLMIDLDRFKEINDTLGHHIGDSLLKEVGHRLVDTLRQIDTVARLGGDEYAVLLPDTGTKDAKKIAAKILMSLDSTFVIDEFKLLVKASVGMAEYPTHGTDAATLIQRADVAMYVAKRGQLGYTVYNAKDDEYSIGRLALISDLRHAIDNNSLQLKYQPTINFATGEVVGVEALLRWEHDRYGAVAPDQIVSLAEQTGMITSLTSWVLSSAMKQSQIWRFKGININVSINLSAHSLKNTDLIQQMESLLANYKITQQSITLEITENAMMANPKNALDTLLKLSSMGIKISIDDFGTGFSSLAYLKKLPVDELKIDKSFIMDILADDNDRTIVLSTIELAHNLGIRVVAEGVESAQIYQELVDMQCDLAQGFHISKPVSPATIEQIISVKKLQLEETIA